MTVLFSATSIGMNRYPWLAYVRAFAEAGMVGACADWFAVVALFRRPFGLPIPHTGIVPSNQERIAKALGPFIADNFLARAVVVAELERIDAMEWCASWLRDPSNGKRLKRRLRVVLPVIARTLPDDEVAAIITQLSLSGLEALPAAPLASKLLAILWAQSETQVLLDRVVELARTSLIARQDTIKQKVSRNSSPLLPKWLDKKLADTVMDGLVSTFAEMRSPDHPWRLEFRAAVEKLIFDLAHDPSLHAHGESVKAEILKNQLVRDQINRVFQSLETTATTKFKEDPTMIAAGIESAVMTLVARMDRNDTIKAHVNAGLRRFASHVLMSRRIEIGTFVTRAISNWNADTLVYKLETQVGRDLQFIRINGTLVGGGVGLAIYVISRLL